MNLRRVTLTLLLFAGSMSWAQSSQFRGRAEIETTLSERMLKNQSFTFGRYLQTMTSATRNGILLLLGGYSTGQTSTTFFENGDPNSVNMLIYDLVLDSLSNEIAQSCISTVKLNYSDDFRN